MKKRYLMILCTIAVLFAWGSCQSDKAYAKNRCEIFLYLGKSMNLKMPDQSTKKAGKKFRYQVSKKGIVTVSKSGRVFAKKAGTTVITMTKKGKEKKVVKCKVRVISYVRKISLTSASHVVLKAGETSKIRANVVPKTADGTLTYKSLDEAIVKVNKAGKISAVDAGLTYIDVITKGKTQKGKKLKKRVLVYVSDKTVELPKPVIPEKTDLVLKDNTVVENNPDEVPVPAPTSKPTQTLEQAIAAIPTPDARTLLAASFVITSGEKTSTIYFLNRAYEGDVSLSVDGVLLQGSGKVTSLLARLESEVAVLLQGPFFTDSEGTSRRVFRIGRDQETDPWVIQNRQAATRYSLSAYANDTFYGTPYGLIVADGDTLTKIQLK